MLSHEEIEELATSEKESPEVLGDRLAELKLRGANIIENIKYVCMNQNCSLAQAKDIVVNSSAWAERKEDFLRQQEDAFEEFIEGNKDSIEFLEMSITPDGTKVVVRIRAQEPI